MSVARSKLGRLLAIALSLGLAPTLLAGTATTYKWVDANGNITFGDHPPKGVEAEEIRISTGTSSSSAPDLEAPPPPTDSLPEEKQATQTASSTQMSKEEAAQLCEQAKSNLEVLENHALIRQTGEDGEVRILEESEKQEQIATAQQIVKDYCK